MSRRLALWVLLLLWLTPLVGAQDAPLQVVATTSIIADVARHIGGERVAVSALLPPEADPHAYQPAPRDIAALEAADVVLVNGFGLEAFLNDLPQAVAMVTPVVVSAGVEPLPLAGADAAGDSACLAPPASEDPAPEVTATPAVDAAACDPHVWLDPNNVMIWAENIAAAFAAADPENAAFYQAQAEAYREALAALDEELRALTEAVPPASRVLVVYHNFLAYFAAAYDFEIVGVVVEGASTLAEPSPQDLAALLRLIETRDIAAIFIEYGLNARLAETIAQEAGLPLVPLYGGALSDEDAPAATYIDYMRYNAQTIVDALLGAADA